MKLVRDCLAVKKGENIILVTDEQKLPIARHVAKFIKERKAEVTTYLMAESVRPITEATKLLQVIMKRADAIIYMLDARLKEKSFRSAMVAHGMKYNRICMMPGITEDMMTRLVNIDLKELDKMNRKLMRLLRDKREILVTNPQGTRILFSVKGRKWVNDSGNIRKKGSHGNLPAGECYTCPVEESFTGTIFISLIEDKIGQGRMVFEKGKLVSFEGEGVSEVVRNAGGDMTARVIGEVGIGTNSGARVCENMLEAEKAFGTAHFAIGDSYGLGKNKSRFHADALVEKVTLVADGKTLIENGQFRI
jgi:leucyl aminopeptidase (aminopeptidase T)